MEKVQNEGDTRAAAPPSGIPHLSLYTKTEFRLPSAVAIVNVWRRRHLPARPRQADRLPMNSRSR